MNYLLHLVCATVLLSTSASVFGAEPGTSVLTGTQQAKLVRLTGDHSYVLRGEYHVPAGKTLKIAKGVSIVAEKDAQLSVSGSLDIAGSEDAPVVFRGSEFGFAHWKGIKLSEADEARVEFTHVYGAEKAFYVMKGSPVFRGCVLAESGTAIEMYYDKSSMEKCLIVNNQMDGIVMEGSAPVIASCTIARNGRYGVSFPGYSKAKFEKTVISQNAKAGIWGAAYESKPEAHDCFIGGNGEFDIHSDCDEDWDFSGNWWGADTTKLLVSGGSAANLPSIRDGRDVTGKGTVRLDGFLTEMPKDCGAPALGAAERQITKGSKVRLAFDSYIADTIDALAEFQKVYDGKDEAAMKEHLDTGHVLRVKAGTGAVALAAQGPAYGVRILDGEHAGSEGWVLKTDVRAGE